MFSPYVLVGLVVTALLAAATGYGLYERGNAATARAESAEALVSQYKTDLAESEADKAYLRELQKRLDVAVRERDKRAADLRKALGELDAQYEQLEKSLPKEDQDCLHRSLPNSLAERLREPEPGNDKDGSAASPRSAANPVPDTAAQ